MSGLKPPRTREELNKDYNFHVANLGSKLVVIKALEEEVIYHTEQAGLIKKEAQSLPPEPVLSSQSPPSPEIA